MTEPCTPKGQERNTCHTEETSKPDLHGLTDSDSKTLKEWIQFERTVFWGQSLGTKFAKGRDKLVVETYAAEYYRHYAMKKKAEMLRGFATMLVSGAAVQDDHKEWIREQLKEDNARELLLNAKHFTTHWNNTLVSLLDKHVVSEINKRNTRKLEFLDKINHNQNEFQADYVAKKMAEFKKLKCEISSAKKFLELLSEHFSTYFNTMGSLGDRLTKNMGRHDLVTLWFEEKRINELAVQKKKEQKEKARDACEASWSKVGFFLKTILRYIKTL
ncbi:uncharacterized protein LOC113328217 isoform X1 [Papaver somniferum]|uniref:uncharacterized protein LOC113328217 isoform X1 n=1 Tax=Papaver somniferum TaxID=3469 RepID=UPI000E7055E7|nr:uncharacterized protein LOC113328217 isoform X1 [Papaver somniferum]XP_026431104.1 uncharacterized protein LOC113328217 isoform X1 [Papaver somniferum]